MKEKLKTNFLEKLLLIIILIVAFSFRAYDINWDNGFHLHPDERAIVMFTLPLQLPHSFSEFLSVQSPLNPHFFAYGSFPLYLLKAVSVIAGQFYTPFAQYSQINILGRYLSIFSELGTVIVIFLLGKKIWNRKVGYLAALLYSICVLPIQYAHFYAVDPILTFFITLTLYQLLKLYQKPTTTRSLLVGLLLGLSFATKDSSLPLLVAAFLALTVDFLLLFIKSPHKIKHWTQHLLKTLKPSLLYGFIILSASFITFFIFEPYAFIDFKDFLLQTQQQSAMTNNAFVFPYTLQYVGKIPYFYELKNVFLWGMGPVLALTAFLGTIFVLINIFKKHKLKKRVEEIILFSFAVPYFLIVGHFAVGFMRYILPLYPLLCLFGAVLAIEIYLFIKQKTKSSILPSTLYMLFLLILLVWPLSFMHIYTSPNTRVLASNWIYNHVSANQTLAVEHWDDQLPLGGTTVYQTYTLPLYDQDTPQKWTSIDTMLSKTDYIIIASNRLYVPLQKLTDCAKLPIGECYTKTAKYYKNLFSGNLGLKKVAEFAIYPTIPILNFSINDQGADESFTVYDHPKVMIFGKTTL